MANSTVLYLSPDLARQGRVFAIGDIHGCFDLVQRALDAVNLDPAVDTVVAVGDLIDRGPDSARCVSLLKLPFVYSTLGNHEDMLLSAQHDDDMAGNFILNGGRWWLDTSDSVQGDILDLLGKLPIAIELATPRGLVGFVHADVPLTLDWPTFLTKLKEGDGVVRETALWGRKRLKANNPQGVQGVGRLFVGHTPGTPRRLGNVYTLDTGAVFAAMGEAPGAHLSIADVLCQTQVLSQGRMIETESAPVRIIENSDEPTKPIRPFGRYAMPRGLTVSERKEAGAIRLHNGRCQAGSSGDFLNGDNILILNRSDLDWHEIGGRSRPVSTDQIKD